MLGGKLQAKQHTFITKNTGKFKQSSWQFIQLVVIIKVVTETEVRFWELFNFVFLMSCRSSKVFLLMAQKPEKQRVFVASHFSDKKNWVF